MRSKSLSELQRNAKVLETRSFVLKCSETEVGNNKIVLMELQVANAFHIVNPGSILDTIYCFPTPPGVIPKYTISSKP